MAKTRWRVKRIGLHTAHHTDQYGYRYKTSISLNAVHSYRSAVYSLICMFETFSSFVGLYYKAQLLLFKLVHVVGSLTAGSSSRCCYI